MKDNGGFEIVDGFYVDTLGMNYYHVKRIEPEVFSRRSLGTSYSDLDKYLARTLIRLTQPEIIGELIASVKEEKEKMRGVHGGGMRR